MMETVFQIIFMIVVFACFTVVFAGLAGIRKRESEPMPEPEKVKPREPERHRRDAQIARAILYGCTAAEIKKHFTGYSKESFLNKSKIYTITRNVCKNCKVHPVEHNSTMTELRYYKDKFLPQIDRYLKYHGTDGGGQAGWKIPKTEYIPVCVGGGGGDPLRSAGGAMTGPPCDGGKGGSKGIPGFTVRCIPGSDYSAVGPDGGFGTWLPNGGPGK